MENIALVGHGGHAKVIMDAIKEQAIYKVVAIFDDKYSTLLEHGELYYGPILSVKELLPRLDFKIVISIGNNKVRKQIVKTLGLEAASYATVIHPTAVISPSASIGLGTVIMPNAVVNAESTIGQHVILNTGAVVEHDNFIEDYVHVSPNATLTGAVTIQEGAQVGAGATIIPNTTIGQWSIIGAGTTVIRDIPSFCTAVGCPARIVSQTFS